MALATILQSEGFLPALRKPAWLPLLSSFSYLTKQIDNHISVFISASIFTGLAELEISGLVTEYRDAS